MSTAAINPKGPRVVSPTDTPSDWARTYLGSTVGQKILVGLTGVLLVGFLMFHMIGNLKVLPAVALPSNKAVELASETAAAKFPGDPAAQQQYVTDHARAFDARDHLNTYAEFLKHDLGALIWVARGGLLALFVTHVILAVRLRWKVNESRPIGYQMMRTAQASVAAKTMLWTGLVVLLFTAFHLAHYTFGWVHGMETPNGQVNYLSLADPDGRHDVYTMVIAGFSTPWISILYILSQALLFVHLSHGIQSSLQTLGLVGKRFTPVAKAIGYLTAGVIFAGNMVIVLAVWTGIAKPVV